MTLDDHCQRSGRAGTLRLCLSAFSAALEAAGASEQSLMPFGNGVCFARQQGGLTLQRMPACCALHMRSAQLDSHEIREESDGDKKSKFVVYSFRATQAPPPVGVPEYPLKPLLVCRWAFAVRPPAMATDTSQPRSRRPRLARAQTRCVFPPSGPTKAGTRHVAAMDGAALPQRSAAPEATCGLSRRTRAAIRSAAWKECSLSDTSTP